VKNDSELLVRFIAAFERLDDLGYYRREPPPPELLVERDPDDRTSLRWCPTAISTTRDSLSVIQSRIGTLPSLFEQLALSFRWLEVDLGLCRLLPNEPAEDLKPLAETMFADPVLNETLIPARLARFAVGSENYDPICFDLNRWNARTEDCPVVRLDHESILMHDELGDAETIYGSFREMLIAVIDSVAD
jgi:hypothetical protein